MVTSLRGTCLRRKVGCVLMDEYGIVLSTGYNGVARGLPHCGDPNCSCDGHDHVSGFGLESCEAIHAEQNALIQCTRPMDIYSCYVTVSPCVSCVKMLLNTPCVRIVFGEEYAHGELSGSLWRRALRGWFRVAPTIGAVSEPMDSPAERS